MGSDTVEGSADNSVLDISEELTAGFEEGPLNTDIPKISFETFQNFIPSRSHASAPGLNLMLYD